MSIFSDKLSPMLNFRAQWLSARANIITENITASDIKGSARKDIRPFHEVIKRQKMTSGGKKSPSTLKIVPSDTIKTNQEVAKELEMLELSRNTIEHDSILTAIKNFHQLVKIVINLNQGN